MEAACRDALLEPRSFLQKFDFQAGKAVFRPMTRQHYWSSVFLDDRIDSAGLPQVLDLKRLLACWQALDPPRRAAGYIFHTAYCCSTLLARAIDWPDKTLVYREPPLLHQLAVLQRRRREAPAALLARWDEYLNLSIAMLSRTCDDAEVPIIKTTDSCNNIIEPLLRYAQGSAAILLYSQLEDFMISNLKSEGRRAFLRNFLGRAQRDLADFPDVTLTNPEQLSDARAAAFVWMMQILSYRRALAVCGPACKTLDARTLLDSPFECLAAVSDHLDLGFDDASITGIITGPVWRRHAKDPAVVSYTRAHRMQEKAGLLSALEPEISEGIEWIRSFPGWSERVYFGAELI
jgi:hypothetical protein